MEDKATLIETLFEKAESYAKTNLILFKLKAIDQSADVLSTIVSKIAVIIVVLLIILLSSIGLSLWIGELIGKVYYGFFIVAGFYILVALILHFKHGIIKSPVNDSIILKMLNEKKDEKDLTQ
ncbi:MAG: hypothetical protein GZ094_20465 [Mariniphaga sp.]|nr:hypothetical protein [Mariniphaga sp.]